MKIKARNYHPCLYPILVSCGKLVQEILEEYPSLEAEDIKQSLQYAEWLVRQQRIHPRELQNTQHY
jgi:hypothetical protein